MPLQRCLNDKKPSRSRRHLKTLPSGNEKYYTNKISSGWIKQQIWHSRGNKNELKGNGIMSCMKVGEKVSFQSPKCILISRNH